MDLRLTQVNKVEMFGGRSEFGSSGSGAAMKGKLQNREPRDEMVRKKPSQCGRERK